MRGGLLALFVACGALAAGAGIPDLGAAALGQAGATVARPADGTAIYYNPAALASLEGTQLYLDARAVGHDVRFQRLDASGQNPAGFAESGSSGISVAPFFAATTRWRRFAFALGGHPATGSTGYHYADPATVRSPREAPQRYLAIDQTSKIYIPVLAAAAEVLPGLAVGAALQLPIGAFSDRQSVYAGPIAGEFAEFDAILSLHATETFARSGVLGVSWQPRPWLAVGSSLQLQTHFRASGNVEAQLPPVATSLGLRLRGDRIAVDLIFPWIARTGVRVSGERWSLELAGTFERWSLLKEIRITPVDIAIELGGKVLPLAPIVLQKHMRDSGSVRLGGELRVTSAVVLRAGVLAESSAIPEERQGLDWLNWQRLSLNLGVGARLGRIEASLAVARFLQPIRRVRDSQDLQLAVIPGVTPAVVGNGDFDSRLTLAAASLSTRL